MRALGSGILGTVIIGVLIAILRGAGFSAIEAIAIATCFAFLTMLAAIGWTLEDIRAALQPGSKESAIEQRATGGLKLSNFQK